MSGPKIEGKHNTYRVTLSGFYRDLLNSHNSKTTFGSTSSNNYRDQRIHKGPKTDFGSTSSINGIPRTNKKVQRGICEVMRSCGLLLKRHVLVLIR